MIEQYVTRFSLLKTAFDPRSMQAGFFSWTKRHWARGFSEYFGPLITIISPLLQIHSSISDAS
jgi:hypothetical protein